MNFLKNNIPLFEPSSNLKKVLTGTMLSLFIPQNCGDHMCSLTENYNNSELYHRSLFYCNCLSMFLFFCSYIIELRREEWCVKYLDIEWAPLKFD